MTTPPHLHVLADDAPAKRSRRQVAVPQAAIARAIRAARDAAGPNWRIEIETSGSIIRLFQGELAPSVPAAKEIEPVGLERAWRL